MKWKGRRRSSNVEDRRGSAPRSGLSFGSGGGGMNTALISMLFKFLFTKTGLIIAAVVGVILWLTGTNPLELLGFTNPGVATSNSQPYEGTPEENELAAFSSTVLADTEDVWNGIFQDYREPTLVLFSGQVKSACGSASSATGPFYCSADEKLYIDLSFFADMERKLNAPGDFAQAYVIAHEVGHHIQKLTGVLNKLHSMRGNVSEKEYNRQSVMVELQADFYAGVWAHHTQRMHQMMETGDLEEAMNAAHAIGDDRLQKQATGRVTPDSFTHGTSAQRMKWFRKGFETGDPAQGDTFNASDL